MALLQNTTYNILFVDSNEDTEAVTIMESPKKLVEAHEVRCDVEEEANVKAIGESSGDQNVQSKECISTETDTPGMSSSKPTNTAGSDVDVIAEKIMKGEEIEIKDNEEPEGEDDENDEKEYEKKKKGIYDMPLEVEGKRERYKVDRISITTPTVKKPASVQMGDGVPLGEVAYIDDQLKKHSADELKTMHRVLYGHPGKASIVKREIRKFTGFAFKEDSQEFKKKVAFLQKLSLDQLKTIKNVLGLHSGGQSKDAVVTTIMVFLMKTVDHARRVAKKRKSSGTKTPSATKRIKKSKDEIHVELQTYMSLLQKRYNFLLFSPQTMMTKICVYFEAKQSDTRKETASKAESGSDTDNKKKKSARESKVDSDADTSSSTSLETLQETRPSEKELETVIEELLSQVDLSQVSMKQMCQAVIEKFPGTNIGNRVDYLKSLIKQSLSTK
ncbi:hypothetical protein Angca_003123 [Angiostrongylus cantonensis]|nr:hypothetical protein Angca_003123 [Angiostrongylus cantonensis]